ncbi:MAG: ribosome-associated translation inhibitor RaiA [Clostridia bacterium]|nr:ribosome-associated translation inhibitor RaiA [Clostridia bacterium]
MKLNIRGKNMNVSAAVTQRIERKTERMSRYLPQDTEMHVTMKQEKNGRRVVELTVPLGDNVILRSEASEQDNLFLAIDQALAKMEKQIHRHRTKLSKRLRDDAFTPEAPEFIEEEVAEEDHKVVRHKQFTTRPMAVEEAMMQMELLGHDFFVFVNSDTERTNVLYLRKDGDYGLMEPEA